MENIPTRQANLHFYVEWGFGFDGQFTIWGLGKHGFNRVSQIFIKGIDGGLQGQFSLGVVVLIKQGSGRM